MSYFISKCEHCMHGKDFGSTNVYCTKHFDTRSSYDWCCHWERCPSLDESNHEILELDYHEN